MHNNLQEILENETYKKILSDSFGGIAYMSSNRGKYNSGKILKLWEDMPEVNKEASGGITQGVFQFLTEKL